MQTKKTLQVAITLAFALLSGISVAQVKFQSEQDQSQPWKKYTDTPLTLNRGVEGNEAPSSLARPESAGEIEQQERGRIAREEYARRQAADDAQQRATAAAMLLGVGNAIRNAAPQPRPMVNCTSLPGRGGLVSTTCY
ncbi:hypothetical protein [Herbaspirillum chlorophenolicum]|uniref:hypothetical protein n=1 Tax=Herbaspirillum chlorophenolicum TaxID=211589 RepID=UPI0012E21790|nr:hypothetical protein [Herbaspirillum chlorophenolicum]